MAHVSLRKGIRRLRSRCTPVDDRSRTKVITKRISCLRLNLGLTWKNVFVGISLPNYQHILPLLLNTLHGQNLIINRGSGPKL